MKSNSAVNNEVLMKSKGQFIRNGTSGQWKTAMTDEMVNEFDQWTAEKLKNHPDLKAEFS